MPRRISLYKESISNISEDGTNRLESSFKDLDSNLSITINPLEMKKILSMHQKGDLSLRELMNDSSATGVVLKANEPWREAATKLYYDFLDSMQTHKSELHVFDTVADFIQNCSETLSLIRGMKSKIEIHELSNEEINLENERNTWRLIYCLYQNRLDLEEQHLDMDIENDLNISEKEVIEALYKSSKLIREYQLIIDWLENNALDQADRLPTIENFTDKTIAWENTLHQLQSQKTGITFKSSRSIVTSLDPDAPVRENKPLHDLDKEDDMRLEKRMFLEVRCGRLQRAQELAKHCGQHWRAACLLGWAPYHDPNFKNPLNDVKLPVEGNPNRDLWKLCAWDISNDNRIGIYYRAIYSSLCGNVKQLLQTAQSWQDGLWCYMKTLLDIKVEAEVRGFMPKKFITMPDDYWRGELTLGEIFQELEGSANSAIHSLANQPAHRIQKYLILDNINLLMNDVDNIISEECCDNHLLRFLAHLVLFFRQIGKNMNEKVANKVLLTYVEFLSEFGDPVLVAFYTSTLPKEAQITSYARFLETVTDSEDRKKCLSAAEDANLDVEAITKLVVENIRKKNTDLEELDLKGQLTPHDWEKINALDWLIFYPTQREEALKQSNALIRYFLIKEMLDAARKAFNKIPDDTIDALTNEFPDMQNTMHNLMTINNLPKKISSTIREHVCYKSYLDAQEGFSEWFSQYHHDRPVPVEDLSPYATFTEKVAYEHKKSQYDAELDRWKNTMQHHTKAVKQLLFNVLLFPDGGWLVDPTAESEKFNSPEEIMRQHQMDNLRKMCIPKTVLLLHTVMTEMNEHAECIKLADILASEQYQLYKVYSKQSLREILKKLCESSLSLMDQRKDPWGYSK